MILLYGIAIDMGDSPCVRPSAVNHAWTVPTKSPLGYFIKQPEKAKKFCGKTKLITRVRHE